ncbi:thioredoxin domain protein, putative [Heliomicrobium modesticaldum Ice1]|uniref:Thioredoxin domain protein, putative n=1 Tax=Heliobacterium modesticaldum (strain ATCC 51547 / Ice1) TaxID=498761 RepID=B0TB47_HELMI|nr:thioredoxin family protein [Heliomicrobium modesticaldum]ABZ83774.1 thioredoxin domain protein, putative [Heliomicrobium modesticaldum Ice1]
MSKTVRWAILGLVFFAVASILAYKEYQTTGSDRLLSSTPFQSEKTEFVNASIVIENAKKAKKPAWILFHSQTCQSCVEMEQLFRKIEPELNQKIAFVDVDVNDPANKYLLRNFEVRMIPTTVLLDGHGEKHWVRVGAIAEAELRNRLERLAGAS